MSNFIQWPVAKYWEKTWNPMIGCHPCSPACKHCYANAISNRFKMGDFNKPHETADQRPPRSGVVFCGNMTDLFGEWMDGFTDPAVLIEHTLGYSQKATYLWLTKRPDAMCDALNRGVLNYRDEDGEHQSPFFDCEFGNQYFGFTAENQECYRRRIKDFRLGKPTWANGWLSAEPLLGPIDLGLGYIAPEDLPFKWIVVGCESGPQRRPCRIEWVEEIVGQALLRRIPVFVKQLDIDGECVRDIARFPKHIQIRQVPWEVCHG